LCGLTAAWLIANPGLAAMDPRSWRIRSWKAEDGLPQNSVTSLIQTRDGYLWFGTFDGLVRFDGVRFKVLRPENTKGLPGNRILALLEDRSGALIVGTEEGRLARSIKGGFKSVAMERSNLGMALRGIAEDNREDYWLLTLDWRLMKLNPRDSTLVTVNPGIHGERVNGMTSDSTGDIWVGTDRELAVQRDGKFVSVWDQSFESGFSVMGLGKSRGGGCWVVANNRVRRFANGKWQGDAGALPHSRAVVNAVCESRSGLVWIGTYGNGLFCYGTNGEVMRFSATNGLPSDFVRCVQEDHEGNIWVGTESGGLARLKPTVFQSVDRSQGLTGDCVLCVCEGNEGELWLGMNGDGINRVKDGEIRKYGLEEGLTNEFVWSICQDRQNRIWAGTWGGGIFRLEEDRFVRIGWPSSTPEPVVCALYEDARNVLWVGQQHGKPEVLRFENQKPEWVGLPSANSQIDIRAIAEDRAGNMWLGTYDDGLYRIKDQHVIRVGQAQGLRSERIRALYPDPEGALWIGTSRGGLSRLRDGRIDSFTTRDGLADDFILHIEEDEAGFLWCSAGSGVFRVSKKGLDEFAKGDLHAIRCFEYTRADGLPSVECTGGSQPSGCKTRDHRLWFPTVAGLAVVTPADVKINQRPPAVIIEQVLLESETALKPEVAYDSDLATEPASLTIPPGKQRFEFHYTGLSYTAPEKVRFKYRLEGLEDHWIDAETRREANYSHVPPGHYTFRVIACNNDGVWNDSGASLAMIVLPHFWQTLKFRVFAGVLVLLLFAGIFEMRLAAERRMTRLRLRIARDLHDEIGSNLGTMALLGEVLQQQPGDSAEELSDIRRIATQTIESLRDIVWFLDPASDSIDDLVARMKHTAKMTLRGIPFEFHQRGTAVAAKPSLELRRNVMPAFKEILYNIARHSLATRVDILVELSPREFLMRIADNGVGFDEQTMRTGNGLKNLRRRAADLHASFQIESRAGCGTTITLRSAIT
jgi:ligand-binding sensor domain-containing protein/signal transduction histidine kinase